MSRSAAESSEAAKVAGEGSETSKARASFLPAPGWGLFVVAIMVVTFIGFAIWLMSDAEGDTGSDRVFIFGAVEALAAAALGWYFGSAVQSERVANAEAEALRASRDAENGRALAALVLSREGRVVENSAGSTLAGVGPGQDEKLRREYADAARLLFPYALSRTKPTDEFESTGNN